MNLSKIGKVFTPSFVSNTTNVSGQKSIVFGTSAKKGVAGDVNIHADAVLALNLQGKDAIVISKNFAMNALYHTDKEGVTKEANQSFLNNVTNHVEEGTSALFAHLYKNNDYAQANAIIKVLTSEPSVADNADYAATAGKPYGVSMHRDNENLLSWSLAKEFFVKQLSSTEDEWDTMVDLLREATSNGTSPEDLPVELKDFVSYFLQVLTISKSSRTEPKFKEKVAGGWNPYSTEKGEKLFGDALWINKDAGIPTMEDRFVTTKARTVVGYFLDKHESVGQLRKTAQSFVDINGDVVIDQLGNEASYAENSIIAAGEVAIVVNYDAGDVIEKKYPAGAHKNLDYPSEGEVVKTDASGFVKYEAPEYNGMLLSAITTDGNSGNLKGSSNTYTQLCRNLVLYGTEAVETNIGYTLLSVATYLPKKSTNSPDTLLYFAVPHANPLLPKAAKGMAKKTA